MAILFSKSSKAALFLFSLFLTFGLARAQNPVLAGDHPDPSIIRVGPTYWASSTSGSWAPAFPLFKSSDMKHWQQVGSIFPAPPVWASGDFWAPELVNDNGSIRLYYAAREKGGPLCVAVATAPAPEGPYQDHGPLVCQPDGSIDPAFIRNADGDPFLVWKEDGNSQGKPTPIWAQPLSGDGLHLQGQPTQLIVNDSPWEGTVTEAPYILRHEGYFYLLYAGNACCGSACTYAEGVARAPNLLGSWEKDPANPIIRSDETWRCPGHGSAVETDGSSPKTYLLFHAYLTRGGDYLAREGVLEQLAWKNGWPQLKHGSSVSHPKQHHFHFSGEFGSALEPGWQWPLGDRPQWAAAAGSVTLAPSAPHRVAMLGRVIEGGSYSAQVSINESAMQPGAFAGLGVLGDQRDALAIGLKGGHVVLWQHDAAGEHILASSPDPAGPGLQLRVEAAQPENARFFWRSQASRGWQPLGDPMGTKILLGWARGLRLGVVVTGPPEVAAVFSRYRQDGKQ